MKVKCDIVFKVKDEKVLTGSKTFRKRSWRRRSDAKEGRYK